MSPLTPANLKRRQLGALRVHPENCARFRFALKVRHLESNRYFPADERRRGTREQQPRETEFVARDRGGVWAVSILGEQWPRGLTSRPSRHTGERGRRGRNPGQHAKRGGGGHAD